MKKIFYILSAAVVMATACTREFAPEQKSVLTTTVAPQEGDMARVTFSVTVPETALYATQTRAQHQIGEQPAIENGDLYVAVFGGGTSAGVGGRLQHYLKAKLYATIAHDLTDETDATKTYTYKYEVLLPISKDPLVLHFLVGACDKDGNLYTLANPLPTTIMKNGKVDDAYEADLMPMLYSVNGYAAYWQRVRIDSVDPLIGPDGNYVIYQPVDEDGNPLSVETQDYEADEIDELKNIQLIRNFAKITYSAAASAPFTLKGFYLVDTPKKGAVVPYSDTEKYNTAYTTASGSSAILGSYEGYVNSYELNSGISGKSFKTPGTEFEYMYERTIPTNSDPAFAESGAILWVKWKDDASIDAAVRGKERYYKVAFVGENGYTPILRNIQYNFEVKDIISQAHPEDASTAYSGGWLGDVSANVSTAMLDDISNSKSRIVVAGHTDDVSNAMSYTAIGNEKSFDIDFYFYPDASSNDVVVTNGATYSGKKVTITKTILTEGSHPQAIASVDDIVITHNTDGSDNHGTYTVRLNNSESGKVKKGKLRILGEVQGFQALYREVVFTVMEKQNFATDDLVASATPLASDAMNQTTTVTIVLPDELPRDIFPLKIMIEAENNALTSIPDKSVTPAISALPVKYGPSAFRSGNSYYFVKTITFDDYATLNGTSYEYTNEFPCLFKTRLGNGLNATNIKINDEKKEYFEESTIPLSVASE